MAADIKDSTNMTKLSSAVIDKSHATAALPLPHIAVTNHMNEDTDVLKRRLALLEKIISVAIPDTAIVHKLEAAAVWNYDKKEFTIPVHYVSIYVIQVTASW